MDKTTLRRYVAQYLRYIEHVRGLSPHTVRSYTQTLHQMLRMCEFYKDRNNWVLDVTPLRMHLVNHHKRTVSAKLTAIRSFSDYMQKYQNFSIKLKGTEPIKIPKSLPKPIELHYIQEAIKSATPQERLIILLFYGLGIRIGELKNLQIGDISKEWVRIYGKGGKTRDIPLPYSLFREIESYLQAHRPQKFLFEKSQSPLNEAQLRYRFKKAFRRIGIDATPHQLRHSYATHLLNNGARITDVGELLGHKSTTTTQLYTKLASSQKMQAYRRAHPLMQEDDAPH